MHLNTINANRVAKGLVELTQSEYDNNVISAKGRAAAAFNQDGFDHAMACGVHYEAGPVPETAAPLPISEEPAETTETTNAGTTSTTETAAEQQPAPAPETPPPASDSETAETKAVE